MKENPGQAPTNSGKVCAVKGKRKNSKDCPFDPLRKTVPNKRAVPERDKRQTEIPLPKVQAS